MNQQEDKSKPINDPGKAVAEAVEAEAAVQNTVEGVKDRLAQTSQGLLPFGFLHASWYDAADAKLVFDVEDAVISAVNKEMTALFGYHAVRMIGQHVNIFLKSELWEKHLQHITGYKHHPKHRPMGFGDPLPAIRSDGSALQVKINLFFYYEVGRSDQKDRLLVEATIREVI